MLSICHQQALVNSSFFPAVFYFLILSLSPSAHLFMYILSLSPFFKILFRRVTHSLNFRYHFI
jgi:hypothetical protein